MNKIQLLIDKIQNFNIEIRRICIVRIEYCYALDESNTYVPHLIVTLGRENKSGVWESVCINKNTKQWTFDTSIDWAKEKDVYYECFEGGYEDDLIRCLESMLTNMERILK